MKKFLFAGATLIVLGVSAVACIGTSNYFSQKAVKGSGTTATKTITLPSFEEVYASRGVKVILSDNGSDKITIKADDNLIDYVTVTAERGKLRIGIDNAINNVSNADITVVVPTDGKISKIDASSAAKIVGERSLTAEQVEIAASSAASVQVALKAQKCSIDASSAAKIEAALEVTEFDADLSSAAKANLAGTATNGKVDLSSAAKLSAEKLAIGNLRVSTSSGSKATVNCVGTLDASASSGSSIDYTGDCNVHKNTSSGGSVSQN